MDQKATFSLTVMEVAFLDRRLRSTYPSLRSTDLGHGSTDPSLRSTDPGRGSSDPSLRPSDLRVHIDVTGLPCECQFKLYRNWVYYI